MADTQRTVTAILALLADNSSQDISPQDIRDAMVSWRAAHGSLYVAAADRGDITISGTADYYEANGMVWTLPTGAFLFDESDGNGRLTYTGTVPVRGLVTASVSMTCTASSQVTHWRLGVNGTTNAATEIQRKIGTGADVGALSITGSVALSTGDHISLWARNETSATNITIECANIIVITAQV